MSDRFYLGLILALGVFAMLFLFAPQLRLLDRQRKRKKFEAWYELGPKLEPNLANNLAISCNFCGGRSVKKTLVGSYPRKDLLRKVEHQEVDEARFFEYRCAKCGSLIYKERQCLLDPKPVDSRINEASDFEQAKSWFMSGLRAMEEQSYEKAEIAFQKSLALVSDRSSTWTNFAAARLKLKKFEGALQAATRAVEIDPNNHEAWMNRGLTSAALGKNADAENFYRKAIDIDPGYAEAHSNLGILNKVSGHLTEALANFEKAIEVNPLFVESHFNRGSLLIQLNRRDEALFSFQQAFNINPDFEYLIGEKLYSQMLVCDWSEFHGSLEIIKNKLSASQKAVNPFAALSLFDSTAHQLEAAKIYSNDKLEAIKPLGEITADKFKKKICIGYYSPDLNSHPVGFLCAGMLESHDHKKFELIGFSFKNSPMDSHQLRLKNAFDRFIDVSSMSDLEVVALSRELGVDVAVDLAGHTAGARQQIFAYRVAPVQVNYLGFAGSLGASCFDYLLTDKIACPPENKFTYPEKIVYLPNSFLPYDDKQEISHKSISRSDFGLPDVGFVFCSFNNHYKLNPTIFQIWMQLLNQVDGSVLWVSGGSELVRRNLERVAAARGVNPSRLIFAKRLESMSEHLARYRLADLFLDTWPFNAHSTAWDSLWAGLPLLTCAGHTLASRVATSVLSSVGLPELITYSANEYENRALELARNPESLIQIRKKLESKRLNGQLFNSRTFAFGVEAAYKAMYERCMLGLAPDHIAV